MRNENTTHAASLFQIEKVSTQRQLLSDNGCQRCQHCLFLRSAAQQTHQVDQVDQSSKQNTNGSITNSKE